jgi:hypothetical protein
MRKVTGMVDRRSSRGDVFCKFCGDQPGGCIVCVEHQAARAQIHAQRALMEEMRDEARRCLHALLNPGWEEGDPVRLPSAEIVDLVRDAFRWKRQQEEQARQVSFFSHDPPLVATRRRFNAIEWTNPDPVEPEAPPESKRHIDV